MKEKLLKEYDQEKSKNFIGIINDMNQILKNLRNDSNYTVLNGTGIVYKKSAEDLIHQKMTYDVSSNRNKKIFNDDISYINGYLNGKELFDWLKEYKKFISSIRLFNNHFEILTSLKSINFITKCIDDINIKNIDILSFKKYLDRTNMNNSKCVYHDSNFEKTLNDNNVNNIIIPYECKFKIPKKEKGKFSIVKFRITKKIFYTFKAESVIDLKIYRIDGKNKIYEIVYTICNKNSRVENYATIVNY